MIDEFEIKDSNGQPIKVEYLFSKDEDHPNNTVWEVTHVGYVGELLFSFDKKKIYNLWQDYPNSFTPEEKEIFDKEYPYWADFFKDRPYNPKNQNTD